MRVKKFKANWHQVGDNGSQGYGEDYDHYEVGSNDVSEIIEYEPKNGMQLHNLVVHYNSGKKVKVFNPNQITYFNQK